MDMKGIPYYSGVCLEEMNWTTKCLVNWDQDMAKSLDFVNTLEIITIP
jgi:hypothetical protein